CACTAKASDKYDHVRIGMNARLDSNPGGDPEREADSVCRRDRGAQSSGGAIQRAAGRVGERAQDPSDADPRLGAIYGATIWWPRSRRGGGAVEGGWRADRRLLRKAAAPPIGF